MSRGGKVAVIPDKEWQPGLARKLVVPAGLFFFVFYAALFVQQLAKWVAAKLFGAAVVTISLGVGPLRDFAVWYGQRVEFRTEWWWGLQVTARGGLAPWQGQVIGLVGPLLNATAIALVLWDARRDRSLLTFIVMLANLAAIAVAVWLALR
jgi:hypothetical protein